MPKTHGYSHGRTTGHFEPESGKPTWRCHILTVSTPTKVYRYCQYPVGEPIALNSTRTDRGTEPSPGWWGLPCFKLDGPGHVGGQCLLTWWPASWGWWAWSLPELPPKPPLVRCPPLKMPPKKIRQSSAIMIHPSCHVCPHSLIINSCLPPTSFMEKCFYGVLNQKKLLICFMLSLLLKVVYHG